ncbi:MULTISPECIES: hypothetical protein [unclassified Streptomyces]|uniref:hypothetical protein n=1 Tax=unclassified Streptomyces TaxID=2593676 RepID=UPI0033AD5872
MDTSDGASQTDALGKLLLGYWDTRERFMEAGLGTNRSDPIGGLAEALIAAALWPAPDVSTAYARARAVRTGHDASGRFGPALGSMPLSWNGKANTLAVDLAAPWQSVLGAVPNLEEFSNRRRLRRIEWDQIDRANAENPATARLGDIALHELARIQVKARFAPSPWPGNLDAVPFDLVRTSEVAANDLYALLMFARVDEVMRDLRSQNFVWTAVLLTDECLRSRDRGVASAKLGWREIHQWWHAGHQLPEGAHDVTELLRGITIAGW